MATRRNRGPLGVPTPWLGLVLGAALVAVAAALWWIFSGPPPGGAPAPAADAFAERLRELATRREAVRVVADDPIRKVDGLFVRSWTIELATGDAADGLAGDVAAEAAAFSARVAVDERGTQGARRLRVEFVEEAFDVRLVVRIVPTPEVVATATPVPTPRPRPTIPPQARGRLALLLDDGGQSLELVDAVTRLDGAVAVAVLPFLPYSAETATTLAKAGHEVWLHLPMEAEPGAPTSPGAGAVTISMTEQELRTTVHAALNNVPHAVGVNNHMGSRATADLRTMTWVMQELKARGMRFIDSRTSVRTVAEDAARMQGVPASRRHVFLDNTRTPAAVRAQLAEAIYRARSEGEAIAIGHLTEITVETLAAELPTLSARGVDLVPPSELTR